MNRNPCYCSIREKDPDYYKKQAIPDGYCGFCIVCQKPGHTSHVPAALPYTGTWCDEHYQLIMDAFSPNFEKDKVKKYFKSSFINPKTTYSKVVFIEFAGDMPFRFIIEEQGKITRFKHGDIKATIQDWLVPLSVWGDPLNVISEEEFKKYWELAQDSFVK